MALNQVCIDMSFLPTKRRLFIGGGVLACGLLVAVVLTRLALTGMALGLLLKKAGASEITFNVTGATPWRVVVEDVGFLLKAQSFAAKRMSFSRVHWWSASLGKVRVEQARLSLKVAELKATAGTKAPAVALPEKLPFEELSIDGQIVLQVGGLPDQPLTVKLTARQAPNANWTARVQVTGPGVALETTGTYDLGKKQLDFTVPTLALDVKPWQTFVQQVMPLPEMDGWEVDGRLVGNVTGRYADGKFAATGSVQVRESRVANPAQAITAEGVEFDWEFTDLLKPRTKPGSLRVRELRVKDFPLHDLAAKVSLNGTEQIGVVQLTLTTLGGTVTTEPFTYVPGGDTLKAVVMVDGISVEQIMALTKDLPATATGRVNGRFPLVLDRTGLHLGTGWLELKRGVNAEIAFKAAGLLTAGTSPKSPSYPILQRIESGLLTLGISELRLDIQPLNAPPGRSATLHIAGAPLDPTVKAPVVLDLNVNGPLEKLLKLGLGSKLSAGAKP